MPVLGLRKPRAGSKGLAVGRAPVIPFNRESPRRVLCCELLGRTTAQASSTTRYRQRVSSSSSGARLLGDERGAHWSSSTGVQVRFLRARERESGDGVVVSGYDDEDHFGSAHHHAEEADFSGS